uniref:Glycylpeptide N-tetradecanoyltransferase n=1 Tax=Panagrellus redivivus TaxID=6233 RepID=A0A7E4VWV9_PANRE
MPIVMRDGIGDITNNEIYGFEKPAGNKMVLLTKYIRFLSIEPGTITKYNNERIYFNMSTLSFLQGVIDPDEFKFLLKQCRNAYSDGTKFSQPVLYSEIWTMFRPYMKIFLDIENLIFDDKMREMLKKFPQNTPKQWKLLNLSLREEIVLPIVENLITSPSKSYLHLEFGLDDYGLTCEKLANIAEEMVLEAGFVVEKGPATADMLRTIAFEKESNHIFAINGQVDRTRASWPTRATSLTPAKPPRPSPRPLTPSNHLILNFKPVVVIVDVFFFKMEEKRVPETLKIRTIDGELVSAPGRLIRESPKLGDAFSVAENGKHFEAMIPTVAAAIKLALKVMSFFDANETPVQFEEALQQCHPAYVFFRSLSDGELIAYVSVADFLKSHLLVGCVTNYFNYPRSSRSCHRRRLPQQRCLSHFVKNNSM